MSIYLSWLHFFRTDQRFEPIDSTADPGDHFKVTVSVLATISSPNTKNIDKHCTSRIIDNFNWSKDYRRLTKRILLHYGYLRALNSNKWWTPLLRREKVVQNFHKMSKQGKGTILLYQWPRRLLKGMLLWDQVQPQNFHEVFESSYWSKQKE